MILSSRTTCIAMIVAAALSPSLFGQEKVIMQLASPNRPPEPKTEDGWVYQRDQQTGLRVQTKELTLHPKGEPSPALKYRFIPDQYDALPGNSAVFYLKAMGFLEQGNAREALAKYRREAVERARKENDGDIGKTEPWVWLETPPDQLPIAEVKEYLQLHSFQPGILAEARQRAGFDLDRNFRGMKDPYAYLLPEIQNLRELARTQSLRCRLAVAEGRIDDAMEVIGQQFTLAHHVGQDDFLVSNLVGIAVGTIAWNDALYLIQHADAPNTYWAFASLPSPFVSLRRSMDLERQFLYQQLPVLREVDETPRPAGYWRDFVDRLLQKIGMLASELGIPSVADNPENAKAAMVGFIAAAYPGAKRYLIEKHGMSPAKVEGYPTAQVVFLAMVRHHNHWRDEFFKWSHVPFWQSYANVNSKSINQALREDADQIGWAGTPTHVLLPAVLAAQTASARCDQNIAMIQAVEAIRMYAAENDGKLPPSLDALPVPAPVEPFTGRPLDYEVIGDRAVINGHALPGMRYRLIVRIAK